VEIKTKKHFKDLIESLANEMLEDEELEEETVTGDVAGYNTPFAFTGGKGKKKKKQISTNSTGFEVLDEEIDKNDIKKIKSIVRDVIANWLRDIWIRRSIWKNPK
tara:strand:- start:538 stop:852 length:315 start_codon:yes stop_codon:yes gene_type:complete